MFSRIGFLYFFIFFWGGDTPMYHTATEKSSRSLYWSDCIIFNPRTVCSLHILHDLCCVPISIPVWSMKYFIGHRSQLSVIWEGNTLLCIRGQKHQVSFSLTTTPTINGKPQTHVKRKFQPKVPVTAVLRGFRWSQGSSLDIEKLKGNLPGSRKQELQIPVLKRWLLNYH